ncbi:LysR family transcriptional regulator [Blastococcus litoris]|uniref:LysR family transcriptional regulator n=1 Tax=Blastococcus litoris TaxID=2171622 RepID=UPI000E301302|nr:LysR family transcriptional regulator [Blastococcus litoris]
MSQLVSLTHLQSFLGVVEAASVTAAATALGYTQSAVSLHIKALERELGAQLFHRDRSGMPLTAVGRSFVAEARRMVENLLETERRMRAAVASCMLEKDHLVETPTIPRCRDPRAGMNGPGVLAQHSA